MSGGAPPTRGPADGVRVLIVEDNPGDAQLARIALEGTAHRTRIAMADSLVSARERLAQESFDVILLDLGLPESTGSVTVTTVRHLAPATPIIVLTGNVDDRAVKTALEADADDFLPKSDLEPVSLDRSIRYAIQRRRLAGEVAENRRLLEESRERLRAVLENVSDGIAVVDGSGSVLFANRALAEILGRTTDELEGLVLEELAGGGSDLLVLPGPTKQGDAHENREIEVVSSAIEWDGARAWVASLRDVTERRRLEGRLRAAQRMEAVGQLAGGMAHQINNLLAVVRANADFLAESLDPEDPEILPIVDEVRRSAFRGASLMQRLLAFGRRRRLKLAALDLVDLVHELAETLHRVLPDGIAFEVRAPAEANLHVKADPEAIEQILLNLVVNARDAMPEGGRMTIEVEQTELDAAFCRTRDGISPGSFVRLSVRDTGTGMDADTLQNAFEPFFTTKSEDVGTGLGLPTVYGLVKQQGASIYLASGTGDGTVVDMYFPLIAEQPAPAWLPRKPVRHEGRETILLVDDEDDVRSAAARVLRRFGYEVVTAGDGVEALAVLDDMEHCDLVMTDVVMPNMGGRGLYEALRARAQAPPVVFVSGYSADDLGDGQLLDPRFDVVPKPWSIPELLDAVRRALDGGSRGVASAGPALDLGA